MNSEEAEKIKKQIVRKMLPSVVFDGWSLELANNSASLLSHDQGIVKALFPQGVTDILVTFSNIADEEMLNNLAHIDPEEYRVAERIELAVMARLQWLSEHKEALKESVNILGVPYRKLQAGKMIWRTCDHIWNWAGDQATDYNHYTKRGLLSGVLVSTTLYWINDESENLDATREFLINRINNVSKFGQIISRFKRA